VNFTEFLKFIKFEFSIYAANDRYEMNRQLSVPKWALVSCSVSRLSAASIILIELNDDGLCSSSWIWLMVFLDCVATKDERIIVCQNCCFVQA